MHSTQAFDGRSRYASGADFQKIFEEEMDSLYLLSFLLTADNTLAEQCFVSGLQDAVDGNRVLKEWAHSWAQRVIIRHALRVMKPRQDIERVESQTVAFDAVSSVSQQLFAAILKLDPFARFVYVITVLEHYSDQECSVLLGCARRDVLSARVDALRRIGSGPKQPSNSGLDANPDKVTLRDLASSADGWLVTPPLATSA